MNRGMQERVEKVRGARRREHRGPRDARAEQLPCQQAEHGTEAQVREQVPDVEVQRERGHRAPEFPALGRPGDQRTGIEPVGIGGHVSGMIESTKSARMLVVIDGCPVACAKKLLEHTGFNIDAYTQITDLGIEKNHPVDLEASDIQKVAKPMASLVSKRRAV